MTEIVHLLVGVILSFIVAIPVGPVNLAVVQNSIKYGMLSGVKIAFGSATVEFFYCFVALWGIKTFLTNPNVIFFLQIISVPVLIIMGIFNLLRKKETEEKDLQSNKSPRGDFFLGASLTIVNPILLPFWMGVAAYLKTLHIFGDNFHFLYNPSTNWAFITGVALGSFLFLTLVSFISSKRKSINISTKIVIYKILGIVFLVLAFVQSFNVIKRIYIG